MRQIYNEEKAWSVTIVTMVTQNKKKFKIIFEMLIVKENYSRE